MSFRLITSVIEQTRQTRPPLSVTLDDDDIWLEWGPFSTRSLRMLKFENLLRFRTSQTNETALDDDPVAATDNLDDYNRNRQEPLFPSRWWWLGNLIAVRACWAHNLKRKMLRKDLRLWCFYRCYDAKFRFDNELRMFGECVWEGFEARRQFCDDGCVEKVIRCKRQSLSLMRLGLISNAIDPIDYQKLDSDTSNSTSSINSTINHRFQKEGVLFGQTV